MVFGLGFFRALGADSAVGRAGAQVEAEYREVVTRTNQLRYLLYLPPDYKTDAGAKWPLVLFLHGAGERGSDLQKVAVHGPPKLVAQGREFPFILISPQCPAGQVWDESALVGLIASIQAQKHPGLFAAVAPVCGGGDRIRSLLPSQVESLKTLGVWAFHGAKDNVVPLSESERMVEAFKRIGVPDIQLTVYPEADHDSWTVTYENPALYEWLLKHHR
jgi:predicted peptidase